MHGRGRPAGSLQPWYAGLTAVHRVLGEDRGQRPPARPEENDAALCWEPPDARRGPRELRPAPVEPVERPDPAEPVERPDPVERPFPDAPAVDVPERPRPRPPPR